MQFSRQKPSSPSPLQKEIVGIAAQQAVQNFWQFLLRQKKNIDYYDYYIRISESMPYM